MLVLLRIAARNLVQARRRTLLLVVAIGTVAGLLALLQAMSGGVRENLLRAATTLAGGHVVVGGFYKVSPGAVAPVVDDASRVRAIVERATPELDYAVDRSRGWAKVVSANGSIQSALSGVTLAREPRFVASLALATERAYVPGGGDAAPGDLSRLAEHDAAVIFASQARRLGVRVGDPLTLQTETVGGHTNTLDVRVVAVVRDVGMLSSFNLFVSQDLVREAYGLDADTTGAVWLYLRDVDDAEAVMLRLRDTLAAEGYTVLGHEEQPFFFKLESVAAEDWVGQRLDVTTWRDEVSFLAFVVTGLDAMTALLVGVLLAIIAIGVANAMGSAVRERTREIGAMRAIGMTRGRVLGLMLTEAVLLGGASSTLGAGAGAALALALDRARIPLPDPGLYDLLMSDSLHFVVDPRALATSVAALTVFTALASLGPAIRAGRLRPADALGHVG